MNILEKFFGGKRGSIDNSNLGNLRTVPPSRMKAPPPPRAQSSSLKNCGNISSNSACSSSPPNIPGIKTIGQYYVLGTEGEFKIESERAFYLKLTPKTAKDSSEVFKIRIASNNLNNFLEIANKEFEIEIM